MRQPLRWHWATAYGKSELLGLTWGDLNFEAGTLTVRKAMHEGKRVR